MLKKVVNCYYAHKSNLKELLAIATDEDRVLIQITLANADDWHDYDIIKYDKANHKLSIIQSPTWFTRNEPIVGDSWCINMKTAEVKYRKHNPDNPQIYHSPWMFMADDYDQDWINKGKERTKLWNSIPNLDKKRIGYLKFWETVLKENNIEL